MPIEGLVLPSIVRMQALRRGDYKVFLLVPEPETVVNRPGLPLV